MSPSRLLVVTFVTVQDVYATSFLNGHHLRPLPDSPCGMSLPICITNHQEESYQKILFQGDILTVLYRDNALKSFEFRRDVIMISYEVDLVDLKGLIILPTQLL